MGHPVVNCPSSTTCSCVTPILVYRVIADGNVRVNRIVFLYCNQPVNLGLLFSSI